MENFDLNNSFNGVELIVYNQNFSLEYFSKKLQAEIKNKTFA
jgi:hypothetical protein